MDDLFEWLSKSFHVSVIYMEAGSEEKGWASFKPKFSGRLATEISIFALVNMIKKADLVVVGGWSSFFHVKSILVGLLINGARTAVFSDAPNIAEKRLVTRLVQSMLLKCIPLYFISGREAARIFAETYWIKDPKRIKEFPYQSWSPNEVEVASCTVRRKQSLLNPNALVRVFIANRFIERKGYRDLIEALYRLKSAEVLNGFHFDIAGNGPDYELYREIFERDFPQVKLHGWIETEAYRRLMLDCDIFVHASRFEPYGIPVVDACICKKRVIATSGVCAAVDAKHAGYPVQLFETGDSGALAALLLELFNERHRLYHAAATEIVEAVFAPRRNIASIQEVLKPVQR